jgi:hypothetical protein
VHSTSAPADLLRLHACLRPGDVLLVEGHSRISTAVKYLTQSTWSHAALYTGPLPGAADPAACFVEADMLDGVRAVPLSQFSGLHARVCRPVGLTPSDVAKVVAYAVARLGHRYDLRNVIDLARYLLPTPPVPLRWRRRMLVLGSGDPTRAICSTLIARAFEAVRFPILPNIEHRLRDDPACLCRATLMFRPTLKSLNPPWSLALITAPCAGTAPQPDAAACCPTGGRAGWRTGQCTG